MFEIAGVEDRDPEFSGWIAFCVDVDEYWILVLGRIDGDFFYLRNVAFHASIAVLLTMFPVGDVGF